MEKTVMEFLEDIETGQAFKDIMSEFKRLYDIKYEYQKSTETIFKLIDENNRLKARLEINGIPTE